MKPMQELLMEVCRRRGVRLREILSKSRRKRVVRARREYAVLMKQEGYGTTEIAEKLRVHHSSICNHLKVAATIRRSNADER